MRAAVKKRPGPKPGARQRPRIKPPMHPLGEQLLRAAQLISNLGQLIAGTQRRLASLQLDEIDTLGRIHESLQATLNMHQLAIQELRDKVATRTGGSVEKPKEATP